MEADKGMAETVASEMPDQAAIRACRWLPENELRVYSDEYGRTGFQGGLNWYRVRWDSRFTREAEIFSGRTIDVPSAFIAGKCDWGVYQAPPAFERMQQSALHKDALLPADRRCRPLGAAGAAGGGERVAAEVLEGRETYLTGVPVRAACRASRAAHIASPILMTPFQ